MIYTGVVFRNTRNGTKFGFPTANITIGDKTLDGLFIGYTKLLKSSDKNVSDAFGGRELPSVIFVGAPATLEETKHRLESYILDFPLIDLYGSKINVEIIKKMRDNKKFDSIDKLIAQMKKDEAKARVYFSGKKI